MESRLKHDGSEALSSMVVASCIIHYSTMSGSRDQNAHYHRRWLLFWLLISESIFTNVTPKTLAATPPAELYSPLLAKINNTGTNLTTPAVYPEYTDSQGQWLYFPTDGWTTGFLPTTLYALNTRLTLCPDAQELNTTNWLTEARHWTTPEVSLETNNTQGHDVGFLSFPFQEELKVCVFTACFMSSSSVKLKPRLISA